MRITDELREWVTGAKPAVVDGCSISVGTMTYGCKKALLAIADRIDEEHEETIQQVLMGEGGVPAIDKNMAEHGWVRLPVSEDGDVLHIGELVDERLPFGGYAAPAPIDTMELSRGASGYRWMVKLDAENGALVSPKLLRRHHEPTVENVLRECCHKYHSLLIDDMNDAINGVERDYIAPDEIIAEYAAKLRLAEEGRMSITDELREAAAELEVRYTHNDHDFTDFFYPHPSRREFLAIADRIDAEHERITHNLTDALHKQEDAMRELDEKSVLLPVDANGVPIRVGDVMEWPTGETFEVAGIGDGTLFYIEDDGEYADWTGAITKRHHHTLTVEDVLRQVIASANNGTHVHGALDTEQIVAEYASKLRLASDE